MESRTCCSRSTSNGMAGGPIRWMTLNVTTCRSSSSLSRNRLSNGSERCAPWTSVASAVARTLGSFVSRRFAQSPTRPGFLERFDSVGGSGAWDNATAGRTPAATIIASACFVMNDITEPLTQNRGLYRPRYAQLRGHLLGGDQSRRSQDQEHQDGQKSGST